MNTDEEYVVVKCRWSCVNNAGVGGRGIVEGSVIRISGGTVQDFGSQTVLDIKRTAGDFVMNIVADNVNKRININFVNNSTGGLAFRVTIHELSFVRLLEPA
jgi:predicted methyltransferase MtxX (methanogen marker protein 4)